MHTLKTLFCLMLLTAPITANAQPLNIISPTISGGTWSSGVLSGGTLTGDGTSTVSGASNIINTPTIETPIVIGGMVGGAVASNAALKALSVVGLTPGANITRAGFTTPGDGGTARYIYSTSSCSLNTGAGDNGSQVEPTNGVGCWNADFTSTQPTPMIWGAIGNGVVDDTHAVQAAATAMVGKTLYLGKHQYGISATVTIPDYTNVEGIGPQPGTGITQITNHNFNVIALGNNSLFENFYMTSTYVGPSTSGAMIYFFGSNTYVDRGYIQSPACIGIDMGGNTAGADRVFVNNTTGVGCGGFRVGHMTTGGNSVDIHLTNIDAASNSVARADYGLLIEDSGGIFVEHADFLFSKYGTMLFPGGTGISGQLLAWNTFHDSYLGDTNGTGGIYINTGTNLNSIQGSYFSGTWTSSTGGDGVTILNTGGAVLAGTHFIGHRAFGNANNAFTIGSGTDSVKDTTIDTSFLCGNPGSGVFFNTGISSAAVRNTRIGTCENFTTPTTQALGFSGSNAGIIATGNDFSGSGTPIGGSMPINNTVITNNIPMDNGVTSLSSAATLNLSGYTNYVISGTTGIQNITGGWNGRTVKFISGGGLPFITGGNISNAFTAASGALVEAYFDGVVWHLH